ncbi:AbrB family transcriptional regulator [Amylibacter ulvae]|uniref:AbrB family transcriptional regulator n=1 Tax=Paramylibacter ulvae TaxID=1651968 RepID=A0ABQ3D6R3_9RHOB|nr:AbrB/MazE/SpoVT family DNA-binding domain-containing protein [Amylibacter ulvae]GHA61582.1 AbrB family transcriptional regulator [Amylibacter ulvae]
MQVSKWGNSLAVRLPASLIRELGLKEGDKINLKGSKSDLIVKRHRREDEILSDLRRFRGSLKSSDRLSRDGANER